MGTKAGNRLTSGVHPYTFLRETGVSEYGTMIISSDRNFLKVVAKTFYIIRELANAKTGAGITELSRKLGQPKATVFRILFTLQELGYVRKDAATGAYALTEEFRVLRGDEVRQTLRRAARPFLERLLGKFEQTVNLAVLDRSQALYLEILEGLRSIRMAANVNTYAPIHSTALGKAILAFLAPAEAKEILSGRPLAKLTPKTITSVPILLEHLAEVRRRGYAVDNEENELGARCVAAPVFAYHGRPLGAISVSGPVSHMRHAHISEIAQTVRESCRKVSERMGFANGLAPEK